MTRNLRNSLLATGLVVLLLKGTLAAQGLVHEDAFAPVDLSTYGTSPQPAEGYFFNFEGLLWSISAPDEVPIGYPDLTRRVFRSQSVMYNYDDDTTDTVPPYTFIIIANEEIQENTHGTGPLRGEFTEGHRIEFGRVSGRHGWLFSTYHLNSQSQRFQAEDVDVVFDDVPFLDSVGRIRKHLEGYVGVLGGYDGTDPLYAIYDLSVWELYAVRDLPINFDVLEVENRVETWGAELMYLFRSRPLRRGGFLELFAGARYLELNEEFGVNLYGVERLTSDGEVITTAAVNWRFVYDTGDNGDPTDTTPSIVGPGVVLADSNWVTTAENHIIGPQIGARWFRKAGRWTVGVEGRFLAGLNMQNIRNRGVLGDKIDAPSPWSWDFTGDGTDFPGTPLFMPILREPYEFDHVAHIKQWSPGGELRVELNWQVVRSVELKVGWTGMWLGGIARASDMSDYVISEQGVMDINRGNNDQNVFMNGLDIGLTIGR